MRIPTIRPALLLLAAFLGAASAATGQQAPRTGGERGWIGISFGYDARCEECVDAAETGAIVIEDVFDGSPAARAGLRPGDVLVRVNDQPAGPERLARFASRLRPGQEVRIAVRRGDRIREVRLVTGERPSFTDSPMPPELMAHLDSVRRALIRRFDSLRLRSPRIPPPPADGARERERTRDGPAGTEAPPRPPSPHLLGRSYLAGARVTALNPGLSEYFGVERGVLVTAILDGSPAREAGLRPGDVVVSAGGETTSTVEEFRRSLVRARSWPVTLQVVRKGERTRLELPH